MFRQEPTRSYQLLYGHAEAAAPQYDFVRLVDDTAIEAAVGATAGGEQLNAGFIDSAPWTERHPGSCGRHWRWRAGARVTRHPHHAIGRPVHPRIARNLRFGENERLQL